MNYQRIYNAFIDDRRSQEPAVVASGEYTENHHIVPRSLGGGNDAANLIRLTAEDHFFAHLCLAKIHGGKMWCALVAMVHLGGVDSNQSMKRLALRRRRYFGHIKRGMAQRNKELFGGVNGLLSCKIQHEFFHPSGDTFTGSVSALREKLGCRSSEVWAVVRCEKATVRGWYTKASNPEGLTRSEQLSIALRSNEIHSLFHFDGREWAGTRVEFKTTFGIEMDFQSQDGHRAGWYRTREQAVNHADREIEWRKKNSAMRGNISGKNNPMFGADRRKEYHLELVHKTGKTYIGGSKRFADMIGIDNRNGYASMIKTFRGVRIVKGVSVKSFKGWRSLKVA